jgi:hypothetical protein
VGAAPTFRAPAATALLVRTFGALRRLKDNGSGIVEADGGCYKTGESVQEDLAATGEDVGAEHRRLRLLPLLLCGLLRLLAMLFFNIICCKITESGQ